jgi:hypothetical protein
MTPEGHASLTAELHHLRAIERPRIVDIGYPNSYRHQPDWQSVRPGRGIRDVPKQMA